MAARMLYGKPTGAVYTVQCTLYILELEGLFCVDVLCTRIDCVRVIELCA